MGPKVNNAKQKNANKKAQKDSYLADDKNFDSFSAQLSKLGLELRDITGDGNCCFRALSDQMNGDESLHLEFRRRVCEYMQRNRDEFEPFVAALIDDENDDDTKKNKKTSKNMDAFDLYIKNLEKPGTYADNGVLVAFSRLYNLDINIHQLEQPIWTISGVTVAKKNQPIRQLHLSYHNGEHYSSIRPKGDRTNNPTNIVVNGDSTASKPSSSSNSTKPNNKNQSSYANNSTFFETDDLENFNIDDDDNFKTFDDDLNNLNVETIIDSTGIHDVNLIMETLAKNSGDVDMAIGQLLSQMQLDEEKKPSQPRSNSAKQIKIDKKKEKKDRQMERQRVKILEQKEQEAHSAGSNKKDVGTNQIVDLNPTAPAAGPTEFNVLLNNIEKKSI